MRVNRLPHVPSVISLQDILDIEDLFDLYSPEEPEDPNLVVSTEIFTLIKAGNERVCVVLRADGLTYKSIADITGLTESQIKNIIYTIRKRVVSKLPTKEVLDRSRLQKENHPQIKTELN